MRFAILLTLGIAVAGLSACSTQVGKETIRIGGKKYVLLKYEKGTAQGLKTTYSIAEEGDEKDPIASCDAFRDCVKEVEEKQARRASYDPTPELVRRPPADDPLDPTPEASSDDPPIPLRDRQFGD